MSELLDYVQTSGNQWESAHAGGIYLEFQESVDQPRKGGSPLGFAQLEEEMIRSEAEHQSLINEVRRYFVMGRGSGIEEIFIRSRTLPQLLLEAIPHLRYYFGNTMFTLRPTSDESGWQTLYVDAIWPGDARDAISAIDAFEDEWWIANSHKASGNLTFTYRLV
jgi:hypothetical protein